MDRRATKTHAEREDEEVERLIRPTPKVKPPRHDRRRTLVSPDRDPEIDDDPDLKAASRVASRFAADGKVPARSRETGKVVYISPETLKEKSGDYEAVDPAELEKPKAKPKSPVEGLPTAEPPAEESSEDSKYRASGKALRQMMKGDPALESRLKGITDPGTDIGGLAKAHPGLPVGQVFKGTEFPPEVKTLGDAVRSLTSAPAEKKPKKAPKEKAPQKVQEQPPTGVGKPTAQPEPEGSPVAEPAAEPAKPEAEAPAAEAKPKAKPKEKKPKAAPEEPEVAPEESEDFVESGKHKAPAFQEFLGSLPTTDTDEKGSPLVLDPKTKKKVPFEDLSPENQGKLIASFEEKAEKQNARKFQEQAATLIEQASPEAKALFKALSDKDSEVSQVLARIKEEGHDLDHVRPEKLFPHLKGKLPEGVDSLGKAAQAAKLAQEYDDLPEAERLGIAPPKRSPPSLAERKEAMALLMDTFDPETAASLVAQRLHPEDARALAATYAQAKKRPVGDLAKFAEMASQSFETEVTKVRAPKMWEGVPFEKLSDEKKSEALQKHQMQVAALSLAAQDQIAGELTKQRIPPDVSRVIASFTLGKGDEQDAEGLTEAMFKGAASRRGPAPSPAEGKKLLAALPPGAKKLAQAYFDGATYQEAKGRFLGEGAGKFSERDSPATIVAGLVKANTFFKGRGDGDNASSMFRVAVLDKLRALNPKKYAAVRAAMDERDAREYDTAYAKWKKAHAKWEAQQKDHDGKKDYRTGPFQEEPPPEPKKPARYDLVKGQNRDPWDEISSRSKTAALARRFISTCSGSRTMVRDPRVAVYHGIDPKKNYPGSYPEWTQPHQRDLGETDFSAILASARQWLRTPVLSKSIEGILPDEQLRAALDLSIYEGPYNGQIQATTYNKLLARLAGVSQDTPLTTIREANSRVSSCPLSPKEETPMGIKASHKIRQFAARTASENAALAYDLIDLADKLAAEEDDEDKKQSQAQEDDSKEQQSKQAQQQEKSEESDDEEKDQQSKQASAKYAQLRSALIRTAAADVSAREALKPFLQLIKTLG